ncbi:fluoride efflux transporter CrcB [Geobacter argillaceus]|uniref:Fluoride-specific ion channel FluC n=1 Tax=Geobacter argillaceus TaxID=345631 RepID=A0A562WSC6_9BACT|nr:fluoride efflux transporter CrcB [Geobacter argillaceus]TWJ33508.1 camphor resistance protein CrcB [Geobacter argillaceus]
MSGTVVTALFIAVFGALGCLGRFYLSGMVYDLLGRTFPYGTFVVNILGAFLIGLIMEFALRSTLVSPNLRIGLTVGFLGGLTTFSTFSYETFRLLEEGEFLIATGNVLGSVLICLAFTWLGILAARIL